MKLHKFEEFSDRVMADPERRQNVEQHRLEALAEMAAYTLSELRKHQGMTQMELAETLGIKQASISRLEHADPMAAQLTTLQTYIEALGGTLELTAVIQGERFPISLG